MDKMARRVAQKYMKVALYWASKNRQYRATKSECVSGKFLCPKCGHEFLKPTIYKRMEGKSERLMGCSSCLFLIKRSDIMDSSPVPSPCLEERIDSGEV